MRGMSFNNNDHFAGVFLSVALGTALMPIVYVLTRRLSHPGLLPVSGIGMFILWAIIVIRGFRKKIYVQTTYTDIFSVIFLLATGLVLLHLTYFTDVMLLDNGIKFRNIYLTETDFHLGLVNVLKNLQPPIYPYASGVGFSFYHLNMHLQIEMFNRFFSLDTVRLTFYYFPCFISVF